MKQIAYYIDDQRNQITVATSSPEHAARHFLSLHPRDDTSQITVESISSLSSKRVEITHFRACDQAASPAPPIKIGREDLFVRIQQENGKEPIKTLVISGNEEALRILASGLLRSLDKGESHHAVSLTSTSDSKFDYSLSFITGIHTAL